MGEVHTEEGPKADILVLIEGRARYLAHLGHVKTPEILRGCADEITRLRVALAEKMVVKVKPLEWSPCEEWKQCSKERAPAFGGEYQIVLLDPKDDKRTSLYFEIGLGAFMFRFEQGEPDELGPTGPKKYPTVDAAKAAAQADYERRILSAVDAVPASQIRAEALREAAELMDKLARPYVRKYMRRRFGLGYPAESKIGSKILIRMKLAILALIDAPKVTT